MSLPLVVFSLFFEGGEVFGQRGAADPPPITQDAFEDHVSTLALDRTSAEGVYREYLDTSRAITAATERMVDYGGSLLPYHYDAVDPSFTEEYTRRADTLMRLQSERLRGAESWYFDQLAAVHRGPQEDVDRLRRARMRERLLSASAYYPNRPLTDIPGIRVDIPSLVCGVFPDRRDAIANLLEHYERDLDALLRRWDAAILDAEHDSSRLFRRAWHEARDGLPTDVSTEEYVNCVVAPIRIAREIHHLHERAFQSLVSAVDDEETRSMLLRAREDETYGTLIHHDPLLRSLARVGTENMTPDERSAVLDIEQRYRRERSTWLRSYVDHHQRMISDVNLRQHFKAKVTSTAIWITGAEFEPQATEIDEHLARATEMKESWVARAGFYADTLNALFASDGKE